MLIPHFLAPLSGLFKKENRLTRQRSAVKRVELLHKILF